MGVAERKERHKEELKKDILNAAKELFMEKGYEATSIRNIAEKIEYSPATVYLYYTDKDEIMHAVHQEGFKMLVEYFTPLNSIPHPFERLKALGHAYIKFSLDHSEMYKLIFVMKDPMDHVDNCKDGWDEGQSAYEVLFNTVLQCQHSGYFKELETDGMALMIWSTMHGLCMLRESGHLGHVSKTKEIKPDVDALMAYTYDTFVKFLEALRK
jgi:AcrR family transcriptional regulator